MGQPSRPKDPTHCLSAVASALNPFEPRVVWVGDTLGRSIASHQTKVGRSCPVPDVCFVDAARGLGDGPILLENLDDTWLFAVRLAAERFDPRDGGDDVAGCLIVIVGKAQAGQTALAEVAPWLRAAGIATMTAARALEQQDVARDGEVVDVAAQTPEPALSATENQTYVTEPMLRRAVGQFAGQLPQCVGVIEDAVRRRDMDALERAVHQLACAADQHGLNRIYEQATLLESQCGPEGGVERVKSGVEALIDLCWRATRDRS